MMSKRRQAAADAEEHVCELIAEARKEWILVRPYSRYAALDGLAYSRDTKKIAAVFEVKCRNMSLNDMANTHDFAMLVELNKLLDLQAASKMWGVPSYMYFYLAKDGVVYEMPITNDRAEKICNSSLTETTSAPRTIDGGHVLKEVSKIKLEGATIISTSATKRTI